MTVGFEPFNLGLVVICFTIYVTPSCQEEHIYFGKKVFNLTQFWVLNFVFVAAVDVDVVVVVVVVVVADVLILRLNKK